MTHFPQRRVSAGYLRIPNVDWAPIRTGVKTELRTQGRYALPSWRTPDLKDWPVLGYYFPRFERAPATMLLVIEEAWQEPLGAISAESIANEGFATHREFKSYWRGRFRVGYKPLSVVQVARLRPACPTEYDALGATLLERLYGPWL